MRLRNKKTGEIIIVIDHTFDNYNSLAEINEDWEDVPEELAKPYWFINDLDGEPMKCDLKNCGKSNFIKWGEYRKGIGNYFETKEEAEKAVEKLKAWKRLKDKGFKFERWCFSKEEPKIVIKGSCVPDIVDELDLIFGGEDEQAN